MVAGLLPGADKAPQAAGERFFFERLPFPASGDTGSGGMHVGTLLERVAARLVLGDLLDRMPAGLAQVIGQLVRRDREEVRLQLAFVVVVRQAGQKADE